MCIIGMEGGPKTVMARFGIVPGIRKRGAVLLMSERRVGSKIDQVVTIA